MMAQDMEWMEIVLRMLSAKMFAACLFKFQCCTVDMAYLEELGLVSCHEQLQPAGYLLSVSSVIVLQSWQHGMAIQTLNWDSPK